MIFITRQLDIIFLGIHDVGREVYEWLNYREDANVLALITEKDQLDLVEELEPDLLISGGFRHIVPKEILDVPNEGAINMHGSYLPYNKGANPNVWSIVEDTPAGVSIHFMTEELDGGGIVDRRKVSKSPEDTAKTLLDKIEDAAVKQFKEVWPKFVEDNIDVKNPENEGTSHRRKDFVDLWELDLDNQKTLREFIDLLRGLTHPPYKNAYFEKEGEKYFVEINIIPESKAGSNKGKRSEDYLGFLDE